MPGIVGVSSLVDTVVWVPLLTRCHRLICGRADKLAKHRSVSLQRGEDRRGLRKLSVEAPRSSLKLISSSGSRAQEPLHALHRLSGRLHLTGRKPKTAARRGHRKLTDRFACCAVSIGAAAGRAARFGHGAANGLRDVAAAGAGRRGDALATLSLPVQFLPVGPVSLDRFEHGLEFGIQLDQSLREKRGRKMWWYKKKRHQNNSPTQEC